MRNLFIMAIFSMTIFVSGCQTDANIASQNLAKSAEMFELERRIVFYDAIQGVYLLSIEGKCSIETGSTKLAVTCKTGDKSYKKHHLGISDNVTFFSEQLESVPVNVYNYRVIFKPESIVPNIDLSTSTSN